jgi:4-hydroxy-tetrahydrodipicolinate synthase
MESQFITPAITVFDEKTRPDKEENLRLYSHLQIGGVSGFVVMGSMGEFFSLDIERAQQLIDIAAMFPKRGMRVFAGASRMDPEECVVLSNYAHDKGLDGVMIISPFYFPLSPTAIYDFYSSIAAKTPANIVIYNFPARTGYSILPETILKLADKFKNIRGIKDTILEMGHTADLIKEVKSRLPYFEVYSGFDNNFAHNVLSGGNGCIGGLSNIIPEFVSTWMKALKDEDLSATSRCQRYIDKMMDIFNIGDCFIPVIKMALKLRGIITSDLCAPPIARVDSSLAESVVALLASLNISMEPQKR